ncbi:MAG: esterase family protein [Saprospiraceae bacterium]|nr:esterase family protein [Saprospiraceae bacterium]
MRVLTFIVAVFGFVLANAQQGLLKESLKIKSAILGKEVEYSVYLPAGYDATNRRYPVLYLLHGYTDDETGWTQFGEAQHIADKAIAAGDATAMIIVMPDAGISWYINSYDGKVKYEDFFVKELIPHIDAGFRTRPTKEFRAVAGLSMGGHGSFLMATRHPDLFVACAPLSGAFWTEAEVVATPDDTYANIFAHLYGEGLKGAERFTPHFRSYSGVEIVKDGKAEDLKKVKYYIDCGDDDFLIEGNMALHLEMKKKDIPHEFRVRDGVHDWTYWRTALPDVLKFVSASFHR